MSAAGQFSEDDMTNGEPTGACQVPPAVATYAQIHLTALDGARLQIDEARSRFDSFERARCGAGVPADMFDAALERLAIGVGGKREGGHVTGLAFRSSKRS